MKVNRGNDNGDTPLHHAVKIGRQDLIRLLVEKGAEPNIENGDGMTSLMLAMDQRNLTMALFDIDL